MGLRCAVVSCRLHTDLGSRVSALNPAWNEPTSPVIENERFKLAVWRVWLGRGS